MRAKEFIIESTPVDTIAQIIDIIRRDCQLFLLQVQPLKLNLLYRGVATDNSRPIIKSQGNILRHRVPSMTPPNAQIAIDDFLERETGRRWRESSVFATHDYVTTSNYGQPFAIFPIGEFEFCYSPIIYDLFITLQRSGVKDKASIYQFNDEDPDSVAKASKSLYNTMANAAYTTSDLKSGIVAGVEIMIRCEEYYLVPIIVMRELLSYLQKNEIHLPDFDL